MVWRGADPQRLRDLIESLGVPYRESAKSYKFTCPICHKKKLYIRISDGCFRCWKCAAERGFRGAPEFALAELSGRRIADLRRELYGDDHPDVAGFLDFRLDLYGERDDELEEDEVEPELPSQTWPWHCHLLDHKWSEPGVAYLASRGIPADLAMEYGIRYSPRQRAVVIPCLVGDRLVGWQYRTIDPVRVTLPDGTVRERLRVWSDEEIPRDRVVCFQNRLVGTASALLCEGWGDAIKGHLVGGNVASMGTEVSPRQVEVLVRAGVRDVYVAFDPDAAAVLDPLVRRYDGVAKFWEVRVPKGYKDLGEMNFEDVPEVVRAATCLRPGQIHLYFKDAEKLRLIPTDSKATVGNS